MLRDKDQKSPDRKEEGERITQRHQRNGTHALSLSLGYDGYHPKIKNWGITRAVKEANGETPFTGNYRSHLKHNHKIIIVHLN